MSRRRNKLIGDVGVFLQQYKRKAYPTHDPNDRRYDREIEHTIKSMSPEELSDLMSGDGDEISRDEENSWMNGVNPAGVKFSLNDPVCFDMEGVLQLGAVISLLKVRPIPLYLVELSSGEDVHVYESSIRKVDT